MSESSATLASKPASKKEAFEQFIKNWEWTWATAVLFSMGVFFYLLIFVVIIPSAWMYTAEKTLHWGGASDMFSNTGAFHEIFIQHQVMPFDWTWGSLRPAGPALKNEVRDIIAMTITTIFFILPLVVGSAMQNKRRALRGETGDKRPTGGYR